MRCIEAVHNMVIEFVAAVEWLILCICSAPFSVFGTPLHLRATAGQQSSTSIPGFDQVMQLGMQQLSRPEAGLLREIWLRRLWARDQRLRKPLSILGAERFQTHMGEPSWCS